MTATGSTNGRSVDAGAALPMDDPAWAGHGVAPSTRTCIRVFIADDHRVTLWGLTQLVESARPGMEVVGTATSRGDVLVHPALPTADIVLLDLCLDDEPCSAEFMTDLRRLCPGRVVLITGSDDVDQHREAVLQGARGIVHKSESADVVLRAIAKVHQGELWVAAHLLGDIMSTLTRSGGSEVAPARLHERRIASLTPREREIVRYVALRPQAKQLVMAEELGISDHTLRNHLTTIYSKLDVRGRMELYLFASEHGLGAASPPRNP